MENIKSLDAVRVSIDGVDPETSKRRLIDERAAILEHAENFMQLGGIELPVSGVLEIFGGYLQLCGCLENIAADYERDGSEKAKGSAATIREEYLPGFEWVHQQFYVIREIIRFIIKTGESEHEAGGRERILAVINSAQ